MDAELLRHDAASKTLSLLGKHGGYGNIIKFGFGGGMMRICVRTWLGLALVANILLLGLTGAYAQDIDQARIGEIDAYVAATPRSATASIASLAAYLTKPSVNEVEKARSIYCWVIRNINYDSAVLASGIIGDQSAETVLKTRTGVCSGYARLFEALARASGLDASEIIGFSREKSYLQGAKIDKDPNHAWNAVKIDGDWQLLDCTWAAGYIDSNHQFVRQICDYYFLTPASSFIYDHFPEDPKWQLVENPLSRLEYEKLVYLRPPFFQNRMRLVSHTLGAFSSDCCFTMKIGAPRDVLLNAQVIKDDQSDTASSLLIQRDADNLKVDTAFAGSGNYTLRLFAKRKTDTGSYSWAADYTVEVQPGTARFRGFPKTYSTFHDKAVVIHSPMAGKLTFGEPQEFKLVAPEAEVVSVVADGQWTKLEKNGDSFEGKIIAKGETLQVAAKYPTSKSYYVLLQYEVSSVESQRAQNMQ